MHDAADGEPVEENESRLSFDVRQACRRLAVAIEEPAAAFEQRAGGLGVGAVRVRGRTAKGISGDYGYFGQLGGSPP
ncbi:MAG: hypothetical protein ABGY42_17545, partial [bacterium]